MAHVLSKTLAAVTLLALLAGCAPRPMESDVLAQAVDQSRMDVVAAEWCDSQRFTSDVVAAIDSTSSGVREIGGNVETRGDWASELPSEPESYVAICVLDLAGRDSGIAGDPDFVAFWVGENGNSGGSVILTAWSRG